MDIENFKNFSLQVRHVNKLTKYNSPAKRTSYGLRTLAHHELEFITDGSGEIFTDGELIKAKPNRLFIRTPGMAVEGFTPYHSIYLVFDLNGFSEKVQFPKYITVKEPELIKNLFLNIYEASKKVTQKNYLIIHSSLCQIFLYILSFMSQNEQIKNENIKNALEYIHSNLYSNINVKELSAKFGYSLNHFIRTFKADVGKTPIHYINDLRIENSAILLNETNNSIESISEQCGFNNVSYFNRMFKKKHHKSPSEFRKELRSYYTKIN